MSWKDIPKVELHLHHEGAAPPAFIRGLAQERDVNLTGVFDDNGNYLFGDFAQFLRVYEAATAVLKSPDDYRRLTLAVLEESAKHGVVYTESFISPDFCGGGDLGAWREYLHAIREAADEAERTMGITLRGIVTCIRHFGPDRAKPIALCAAETAGDWIVGFGMGGDETMGAQGDFAYSFDLAREAGLRLTTHAGEWGGAKSIWQAVRDLKVERVGHGIQAIDDLALVDYLAEHEIVLEVCPGSNVALGAVPSFKAHPIAKLRERGVRVTVSTDDPPFFRTTMTREFDELERTFGWGEAEFRELAQTSLDAAFCDADTRDRIAKQLEQT
ncbi:adenosine deaminase [Poseidonocella pacifica]|uniref:Adenosine deaminase n=1 Tax=Poseidonocella pacifica TaxID=871651 RepID=A0A1I0XFX4_9RHOB|nr:adenosine deaminase [Poseidonocella pacifica]SFA99138.1 adenosine deaminase [Poseidonocella pacifica]